MSLRGLSGHRHAVEAKASFPNIHELVGLDVTRCRATEAGRSSSLRDWCPVRPPDVEQGCDLPRKGYDHGTPDGIRIPNHAEVEQHSIQPPTLANAGRRFHLAWKEA